MLRVLLVCRSCGFKKDLEGSDESIPHSCPSCGSKDLEFVVYRKEIRLKAEQEDQGIPAGGLIEEAFLRQVSPGEWEIDLRKTMLEEVSVAEIEPGEYEIVFRVVRRPS